MAMGTTSPSIFTSTAATTPKFHDVVPGGDVTLVLYGPPLKDGEKEKGLGSKPTEDGSVQTGGAVSLFGRVQMEGEKNGIEIGDGVMTQSRPETRLRVSSHHLANASRVFGAMFEGVRFSESRQLRDKGHVEVPLPEDDPEVMLLVMSIIHLRSKSIPKTVNLDMLSRVAVVVDKYELHEALGFVTAAWISALRMTVVLPTTVNEELIKWLFIATVFELGDVLGVLETAAAGSARGRLDSWQFPQLPIPGSLIDSIERRRQRLVEQTLGVLEATIQTFIRPARHEGELHCFQQRELCDLAVLGSLVKCAANHGLYPPPNKPYEGYSPDDIVAVFGSFVLGAGGKCVASGFMTCGGSALGKMLVEADGVRTRAMREESLSLSSSLVETKEEEEKKKVEPNKAWVWGGKGVEECAMVGEVA